MKKNLKYYLKGILNEKDLSVLPTSYDVIGDIMVFADFPKALAKKEKKIADVILQNYRHVKVVVKKSKQYSGIFRLPKLKIMGGNRRKETTHKENGALLTLDVEKVYFSPRSGTERQRIIKMIKPGERVLVMFSGCGPFVIEIAKHTSAQNVVGVEINPIAHRYAQINAKQNKVEDKVVLLHGDVRKIIPTMKKKFDRVLMPLPKTAHEFLPLALSAVKKNGIVHYYDFSEEKQYDMVRQKVMQVCMKSKKKCSVQGIVSCGQYSPGHYRVCADVIVK